MPSVWRKTNGSWVKIKTIYRKTGGSWQSVKRVWRKTAGAWQLVFLQALTPSIATKVSVSTTTSATQTKTLVGKLYSWSNATAVTYQFTKSTDGLSFTNITGASGTSTNPGSGSSNTLDQYILTQSSITANTTNYYQYVSKATNSTYGTEQTSASDYVTLEAPRDLSLTGTKTSTSITVSWTNDTYSGRYEYQYKLTSDATWNALTGLAPGTETTSFTITGLANSTSYDFRVRGRTGNADDYGYYGNWANITVSTNAPVSPNAPTGLYGDTIDKDSFFLGWISPTTDATHDAATGFDFGANTSNTAAPATQMTTGTATTSGQWRTITLADRPNNYELISSLSAGTDYYGWVRSRNSAGVSAWAVSTKITTSALKPPNNITNLVKDTATDSETSLKFTFTKPTADTTHSDATSYMYSYNTTNVAPTDGGTYETSDSTASITISSLSANTTYYIFVKAKNADGLSSTWVSQSGKTKATSNPPGAPATVSASNPSQSGFRFTWSAGTGGAVTSYLIALSTSTTEPTTENSATYVNFYYDTTVTTASYTFAGLNANTTYYCWVKARNADGTSSSVRRNVTTAVAPTVNAPSWVSATNFQRTASTIKWGWAEASISPTTGTYVKMNKDGYFWEFYTSAAGTTPSASGYKAYTTTNDTRTTVNSTSYPYLVFSGGTSPEVTYSANARYLRVQQGATDYDGKNWYSSWTARI